MPEVVRLIDPQNIRRNPENPRLIFRAEELQALQDSIAELGILVPLTVYEDKDHLYLLDGERRWRCALKLGLRRVPVIVQPKPDRIANIMLMFAIHNTRKDWDPLPTAMKLKELEREFEKRNGRRPKEVELAGIASISRGEVQRLKRVQGLPDKYKNELLEELEKPRSEQVISVDHYLEATKGAAALRKYEVIVDAREEDRLVRSIIKKFRSGIIKNTVDPRKLARIARAVGRRELSLSTARTVTQSIIDDPNFNISDAFERSIEQADFEHGVVQLATRLLQKLDEHGRRRYSVSSMLATALKNLGDQIRKLVP